MKRLQAEADGTAIITEDGLPVAMNILPPRVLRTPRFDEDMPDVNNPEAGFSPTEDHTVT
jgi:hypothetical protein